ncbi:MAG: metal ABC transporter substrate-binding protein [Armatimonadetes bacterium]|nr:metal ABC transporter substrate-binding protein [Armatimonadota bacterium]
MKPAGFGSIRLLIPALLIAFAVTGCGRQPSKHPSKVLVAAGIAPMANFAKKVGGDLVRVELIVPPNASPHTYQPSPHQMKMLTRASVLVLNGVKLEFWADKLVEAANNPRLIVVNTSDGLPLLTESDDKVHGGANPHVWLDPINAIRQVEAIRNGLVKADPTHARIYAQNARRFIQEIKKLHADISDEVKKWRSRSFISFHPAWAYFARRYGLREAAVIEKSPGREPSPSEIKQVVDIACAIRARAIFAETQFSTKPAEVIAEEIGAKLAILDPIGKPPDYDYIKTMRANLDQMAKALR